MEKRGVTENEGELRPSDTQGQQVKKGEATPPPRKSCGDDTLSRVSDAAAEAFETAKDKK